MLLLWLGAVALVVVGGAIGRKVSVPDAVIWCALGFAAAFVSQFGRLTPDPHVTLFLLLPPLVYASAVRLPWPEFRDNLRPVSLLAVGLVVVTTAVVAVVAHYLTGLAWPMATALGALISPTDPVAASAVAGRVGLPHRLVAILEGEGLVNDGVALTILRLAIAAAGTGSVSVGGGLVRFLAIGIGEPLYGCLVAIAILAVRARIKDPRLEITVSLLTPFAAYLVPERLGGSGILATVAAGMYVGERLSEVVPAGTRLRSTSVWEIVVFVLNGLLFLIAGIQLGRVIQPEYLNKQYLIWGFAVAAAVVVSRAVWCGAAWALFRGRSLLRESEDRAMPARQMVVIGWAGMRGPISLAAALSVPVFAEGVALPHFETLLFVTAIVIVVTLMVQGIGLPYVAREFGLPRDAGADRAEDRRQQALGDAEAAKSGLDELSRLEAEGRVSHQSAEGIRRTYRERLDAGRDSRDLGQVRRALIEAERARIHELRRQGRIAERAAQELERQLDLRESALADSHEA